MLVKEIKEATKEYSRDELMKIITELYKRIPKSRREYYDIDDYIVNLRKYTTKKSTENETITDIISLSKELEYFLTCVRNDLYCSPNNIITKTERSKWRFKVKKYYKDLISFKPDTEDGKLATKYLISLFNILSYGTHYLKFSSWNTFGAIGVYQSDFLETIVKRILSTGLTKENMTTCVALLDNEYDPNEYHISVLLSFVSCLNTSDLKYAAIEALKEKIISKKEKIQEIKKNRKSSYHDTYDLEEMINYFTETILFIYINLNEIDNGIKYFQKTYLEKDDEVKEYILLDRLEIFEIKDEWIKEYESHIGKIDYRDSLQKQYQELKNRKD